MFEILRQLSEEDLVQAMYWLGLRLRFRTRYSDAAYHRALAERPDPQAEITPTAQTAIAQVMTEIEAAEGKPIHALTEAQIDPYLHQMYQIEDERREPADPEVTERALRILNEMRRDYADVGRRKIA